MENFSKTYMQMFYGIELCIEKKLQFPTLTLIFSVIDSLSYIAYGDGSIGKNFKKWADEYMDLKIKLDINSKDLYSARNAIVHTLTPNSRDTKNNNASIIAYVWGKADLEVAKKSLEISKFENLKFIHINDLFEAVRLATYKFLNDELEEDVRKRMNKHYTSMSQETLEKYIKINTK